MTVDILSTSLTFRSFRVDWIWNRRRKCHFVLARPVELVVEVAMAEVHRQLVLLRPDVRHSDAPGDSDPHFAATYRLPQ